MNDMFPPNLEAFFLDFDGVVVESTSIKTDAFYEIYLPYGKDIAEKAKSYHLAHQGITRSVKFNAINNIFLNKECDEEARNKLSEAFSSLVLEKILNCPLVEGITEFLEESFKKRIPVFLLSATPHEELITIVKNRGFFSYFKEVRGGPQTKVTIGRDILKKYDLRHDQVVFIGDSVSDYTASQELGTKFIGRQAGSLPIEFQAVPVIQDFRVLL